MKARGLARGLLVFGAVATAVILLSSRQAQRLAPPHRAARTQVGALSLRTLRSGHGTPVVLLHGYGESLVSWQGVFDRLAGDADVVAMDLPGFGLSAKPASGYATDSLAAVVVGALDALGIRRAVLVGHSMGGAIAAAVAVTAPDRVRGLVLVDPAVVGTPWIVPDTASASLDDAARRLIAGYEALRSRFGGPHAPTWLAEPDSEAAYAPAADGDYDRALAAVLAEFDFAYLTPERIARLRAPTLLIWGRFDQLLPLAEGRSLTAAIPGARLVVIPRSWHRPHVERPAETAGAILDFVRRLPPERSDSP